MRTVGSLLALVAVAALGAPAPAQAGWCAAAWWDGPAGYAAGPGPALSPYRQIFWTQPPAETARVVRERIAALGIPRVPPEPLYLGKIPTPSEEVPKPKPDDKKPDEKKPDDKKPDEKKPDDKKPDPDEKKGPGDEPGP